MHTRKSILEHWEEMLLQSGVDSPRLSAQVLLANVLGISRLDISADQLKQTWGRGAILDIDYHHGNGTQDIFWDDPEILFISLHADPKDEYPFFSGYADERGGDSAPGTNLNFLRPEGRGHPT